MTITAPEPTQLDNLDADGLCPAWCDPTRCVEFKDGASICYTHERVLLDRKDELGRWYSVGVQQYTTVYPDGRIEHEPARVCTSNGWEEGVPVEVARRVHAAMGTALALIEGEPAALDWLAAAEAAAVADTLPVLPDATRWLSGIVNVFEKPLPGGLARVEPGARRQWAALFFDPASSPLSRLEVVLDVLRMRILGEDVALHLRPIGKRDNEAEAPPAA